MIESPTSASTHTAFERSDVSPKLLGAIAAALVIFVLALVFVLRIAFPSATESRSVGPTQPLPPRPQLQSDPPADLSRLRADEDARLASYGWVDREKGTARIPIDEAMKAVAARGLPNWTREPR